MGYYEFKDAIEAQGGKVSEPLDLGIDIKNRWGISSSWVKIEFQGNVWYEDYKTGKKSWEKPLTAEERNKVGRNALMAFESHDIIALRDSIKRFKDDQDFKDHILNEFDELIKERISREKEFTETKKELEEDLKQQKEKFIKASKSWIPFKESKGSADKRFEQMQKGIDMYARGIKNEQSYKDELVKEMNHKLELAKIDHHNNVKTAWKTAGKLSLKRKNSVGGRRKRRRTKKKRRKTRKSKKKRRKRRRTKKKRRRRR